MRGAAATMRSSARLALGRDRRGRTRALAIERGRDRARQQAQLAAQFVGKRRSGRLRGKLAQHRLEFILHLGRGLAFARIAPEQVGEPAELAAELAQLLVGAMALALRFEDRALHAVEAVGGLLEQRLHVGRHRRIRLQRGARREPRHARQPLLELVVEAVLRVPRLQVEEADHE